MPLARMRITSALGLIMGPNSAFASENPCLHPATCFECDVKWLTHAPGDSWISKLLGVPACFGDAGQDSSNSHSRWILRAPFFHHSSNPRKITSLTIIIKANSGHMMQLMAETRRDGTFSVHERTADEEERRSSPDAIARDQIASLREER